MSPVPAGEAVQGWTVLSDGLVEVGTDKGTYRAEKLVLAGGAWMDQLVPELKVREDPTGEQHGHWRAARQLLWLELFSVLTGLGELVYNRQEMVHVPCYRGAEGGAIS
jgi:glycine/D-amino acid oxidase-like deaminating enzyme